MLTGMGIDEELAGLDWREQEAVQQAVLQGDALDDLRLARAAVRHGEAALNRLRILTGGLAATAVAFGIGIAVSTGDWTVFLAAALSPVIAFGPLALGSNVRRAVSRNRLVVQGGAADEIDSVPVGWGERIADGSIAFYIAVMLVALTLSTIGMLARFFRFPIVEVSRSILIVGMFIAAVALTVPLCRFLSRLPPQG